MAQVAAAAAAVATGPPPSPVQANATTLTTPADIDTKMVKIMMKMMNKMTTTGNLGDGNPAGGKTTNQQMAPLPSTKRQRQGYKPNQLTVQQ